MRLSLSFSTQSSSDSHPLCRTSRSQMFFKISVSKNFPNLAGKHRCFPVKFAKCLNNNFIYRTPLVAASMLLFMNVSSFTSPLPQFHNLLTVLLLSSFLRNTIVFKSPLLHRYYHNSRMIHQDCSNCYDLLYCHFHDCYTY